MASQPNPHGRFPFPFTPYTIQERFAEALWDVVDQRQIGIFESPTGTGKTMSIICSAVHWLAEHAKDADEAEAADEPEAAKAGLPSLPGMAPEPDWFSDFDEKQKERQRSQRKDALAALEDGINARLDAFRANRPQILDGTKRLREQQSRQVGGKRQPAPGRSALGQSSRANAGADEAFVVKVGYEEQAGAGGSGGAVHRSVAADRAQSLADAMRAEARADALGHRKDRAEAAGARVRQLFFVSRTHSQLSQFLGELRRTSVGARVRAVAVASRKNLCVHPGVKVLGSAHAVNEACRELRERRGSSARASPGDKRERGGRPQEGECSGCPYLEPEGQAALAELALSEVLDVEELAGAGERAGACAYYASRRAVREAQVVALPYASLLHRGTREALGIDLNGSIVVVDEAHNIADATREANSATVTDGVLLAAEQQLAVYIARYAGRMRGASLKGCRLLQQAVSKLLQYTKRERDRSAAARRSAAPAGAGAAAAAGGRVIPTHLFVTDAGIGRLNLHELVRFLDDSRLAKVLQGFVESEAQQRAKLSARRQAPKAAAAAAEPAGAGVRLSVATVDASELPLPPASFSSAMMQVRSFLGAAAHESGSGSVVLRFLDQPPPAPAPAPPDPHAAYQSRVSVKFSVLDPGAVFQEITAKARAVVLAGGTMEPVDDLVAELFASERHRVRRFSCGHVVDDEGILCLTVPRAPSGRPLVFNFASRRNEAMLDDLGQALLGLTRQAPGGVVVFLPSYGFEQATVSGRWRRALAGSRSLLEQLQAQKPVFCEPRGAAALERVLKQFGVAAKGPRGALLFAVVGGKLSEGLNFKDELARLVVVIGLPYANKADPELAARMGRLDAVRPGAGAEYYQNLCMKAVNQSIGRAIRHRADWASVVLLDQRFGRSGIQAKLPGWIRPRCAVAADFGAAQQRLDAFFRRRTAAGNR